MGDVREGARWSAWVVAGFVFFFVLCVAGVFAVTGTNWISAPFRGAAEARDDTAGSGTFRLTTYEEFFDLCENAQNAEGSIDVLNDERKHATSARRSQIDQSVSALRVSRLEAINDYNAKAAEEHRAPFHDRHLPYGLDADAKKTQCTDRP
ncbi:hypothetical protein [Streptomyces sp. NPDC058045]|uniref:hypothetical protein n=1 Tax=Streptomyces sp. NPDC058045 TaxID=3346311 RepID=UPI0036E1952E